MHSTRLLTLIKLLAFLLILASCQSNTNKSDLADMDLMKYGLPIKIKAPVDAQVEASDLGFVKDVTVKGDENFYLQITGGMATTTDSGKIKDEHLEEVRDNEFFDELLKEEDHGFIFRKKITEELINHDFRFVRIQGDMEYIFQVGLIGNYSEKDVERMYNAVN
ncbi:MAG: hypothetical protein KJO50_10020 [Bacteroidia bacterium]|nr:hypothetical protein [Bacteroidia bacterium]